MQIGCYRARTSSHALAGCLQKSFVQVDSRGEKKLQIHDVALALNQYSQTLASEALSMLFRVCTYLLSTGVDKRLVRGATDRLLLPI